MSVQLPDGASVPRTKETVHKVEKLLLSMPQVADTFAVIGFSLLDGGNESNNAFMVVKLKPFADREAVQDSAQALIRQVFVQGQQIRSAAVIAFNLPPIIGLSTSGGFEYQLEALEGQDPVRNASVMQGLLAAANKTPPAGARLLHLYGDDAVRLSRHRPRQGAGARRAGVVHLRHARSHARRQLHQQLQPVWPGLAGQHRGRDL